MEKATESDQELLPEPCTRLDLIADAKLLGFDLSERLFNEWRRLGLIGAPQRRRSGPHGQDLALFSSEQRVLFRAIAMDRARGVRNAWLAAYPVHAWLNYGDDWVSIDQLRAALTTAVGNPKLSERVAAITAKALVDPIDVNNANVHARAHFKREVAKQLRRGRIDEDRLRAAVTRVFQPGVVIIIRGTTDAPLRIEAITMWLVTTMNAALKLKTITDEQLYEARLQHLVSLQGYLQGQAARQAEGGPQLAELYADIDPDDPTPAVGTLLQLVGTNILNRRLAARKR
jgi:hypothetical protein